MTLPRTCERAFAALLVHEADRFLRQKPKSSLKNDTGAEENAWNAQILSLAAQMMPAHPRAAQWDRAAKLYCYNSLSVAADHASNQIGDDNRPVREWVVTTNAHADFTVENHGIVHLGYLKTTLSMLLENALPYPDDRPAGAQSLPASCAGRLRGAGPLHGLGCRADLFQRQRLEDHPHPGHRHDVLQPHEPAGSKTGRRHTSSRSASTSCSASKSRNTAITMCGATSNRAATPRPG